MVHIKILKYKKSSNGKYKVFLDNDKEILLYEDVILKYDLLLTKEIDDNTLIEIDKYNQECDVYYVALNSIKIRFKSIYDLKFTLIKKEYPEELVDKAIDKLIKQGYLDDRSFTKSYINNKMITSNYGPYKIERELEEKKIPTDIIKEELEVFTDEEQIIRINKLIDKGIKTNHNRGGIVLKQKIYNDLKTYGYDISLINLVINSYDFGNDRDIAKKEYDKLYKKYSRKYSGEELKRVVSQKMYLKGLVYDEE